MKKAINYIKYTAVSVLAVSALGSCVSDEPFELKGEGRVILSTSLDGKLESRSVSDEIQDNCMVWISNAKGLVRRYDKKADIPTAGIKLVSDHYVAEAWAGDSVSASKDKVYFKGREEFTVKNGSTTPVTITCRIANSVVAVSYADNVDEVLTDYTMTVGLAAAQASLEFEGRTDERGFFMMNSRDKDLDWTLRGTRVDGSEFVKTGKIEACKPHTLYTLNVDWNGTVEELGGGYLTIEIDETEITSEEVVNIPVAPSIAGYNFELSQPLRAQQGALGRRSLFITGSAALDRVELRCPAFAAFGIGGDDFELFTMSDDVRAKVEAGGVNYVYNYDSEADISTLKLNFEEIFTNSLANGDYAIDVTVTDVNGKTTAATMQISISDAPVTTTAMTEEMLAGVWATRATVYGSVVKADAVPGIKYRKLGQQGWTDADVTVAPDGTFSAALTGLEPGTTYEYVACSADFIGADIRTFATEAARQFPEAGFENWSKDDKVVVVGPSASDKFWDSGNTASGSMMGVNPTQSSTEYTHSGNYSACLHSQFVGAGFLGAFAAGNLFVGEFLRTDGTNGVLGWGREWTSRPTKLRGYVRYEPKTVTHEKSDYDALKKGDLDKGIIYIALLDNSPKETDSKSGKSYPVIVRTKAADRQLFNKDASNVIAYGELIFDAATEGDGMIQFEIPLTYIRDNVKPAYIMCTASASIGGDYFVGGEGSKMWLDDFELVY